MYKCSDGTIPTLHDSFDDGDLEQDWSPANGGGIGILETGGVLAFSILGLGGGQYGSVSSRTEYDLSDCGVSIKLGKVFDSMSTGYLFFGVRNENGESIEFGQSQASLDLKRYKDGAPSVQVVNYLPESHKYLRIRETSGKTAWDVSSDGAVWQVLREEANSIALSRVQVTIGCGTVEPPAVAPGTAELDDVDMRP